MSKEQQTQGGQTRKNMEFWYNGTRFLNKCVKPDRATYFPILYMITLGFIVMGSISYMVKLVHIPFNNVLMRGQ